MDKRKFEGINDNEELDDEILLQIAMGNDTIMILQKYTAPPKLGVLVNKFYDDSESFFSSSATS